MNKEITPLLKWMDEYKELQKNLKYKIGDIVETKSSTGLICDIYFDGKYCILYNDGKSYFSRKETDKEILGYNRDFIRMKRQQKLNKLNER
jgi:hypothetical protein